MSSFTWQVILATCLLNFICCGIMETISNKRDFQTSYSEARDILCPSTENTREAVYFPHESNCQMYFICDGGYPRLLKCQPGLHFNPSLRACDYPEEAGCDKAILKPKGKLIDEDFDACPSRNSKNPVLFPHPTDCNKFYICDNGSPHLQVCQAGLHFNKVLKACDYPEKAGCTKSILKPKEKLIDEDFDVCPNHNSKHPVLFPHPTDCSKFYICDNGSPHLRVCQAGLHFNEALKACDYPAKAGCRKDVTVSPTDKWIEDDEDSSICPISNSKLPILLPHPTDCNKFYICSNGSPSLKVCHPDLHFNPKQKTCDFPKNSGCDEGITSKHKGKNGNNELEVCPDENFKFPVFIPHPTDCRKFFICDSGSPHLKTCQPGLHFNLKLKSCDYPENAGCDTSNKPKGKNFEDNLIPCPVKNIGDQPVLLPHPTKCDKFFMCDNGKPRLRQCQAGLNFNMKLQACDYPDKAKCEIQMSDVMTGFSSPFCPPVNGKTPFFYRHTTNCSVYYMCSHGSAYEFVCPARLHFNLRRKVCDYEAEARCSSNY